MAAKKIWEWLQDLNSHGIYDSDAMAEDFRQETGKEPTWGSATLAETAKAIEKRGLGGTLNASAGQRLAAGWEVAESLSERYCGGKSHYQYNGRGRRFAAAVDDLKKADV